MLNLKFEVYTSS